MERLQNWRNFLPTWKVGGLIASAVLCIWTLAGLPGDLFTGILGLFVAGPLLVVIMVEYVREQNASKADTADTAEEIPHKDGVEQWNDTMDTLRDQTESLSQSINEALGGFDDPGLEEGEGTIEEKISQLFEAINAEKALRNEAIKKALILERDVWNRTFAKAFTERVNEVLRHVKDDRDEAISTAIAAERKAWRDSLTAKTEELRETVEAQGKEILRQAQEIISKKRSNANGEEPELALATAGSGKARTRKPSTRKPRAKKKAKRRKS